MKIKMASIVPQNYLKYTKNHDVHMALACFIDEHGYEDYTRFFKEKRKKDSFLILDNGVIEGNPMSFEDCVKKARSIHADEIVLPDVYKNAIDTYYKIEEAIEYYLDNHEFNHEFSLMAVPQGSDMEEWVTCATKIIDDFGQYIDTIGIPKHLIDTCKDRDARLIAISNLYEKVSDLYRWNIHLLGCWNTPLEVLVCAKAADQQIIPPIRSCDSAMPYVYAQKNMKFSDGDRPYNEPIDFKKGKCNSLWLRYNNKTWDNIGNPNAEKSVFYI